MSSLRARWPPLPRGGRGVGPDRVGGDVAGDAGEGRVLGGLGRVEDEHLRAAAAGPEAVEGAVDAGQAFQFGGELVEPLVVGSHAGDLRGGSADGRWDAVEVAEGEF